jgi:hypothetical protein
MRRLLLTAVAAFLSLGNVEAQPTSETTSAPEGLACFENLAAPEYPRGALQAQVAGSVWTWIQVTPQGAPEKIETQVVSAWGNAAKLLTPAVEKAIHAARIKPACAGKKVWVVFRYDLRVEPVAEPKATSRIDGPHIMWIESQPAKEITVAGKSPARP